MARSSKTPVQTEGASSAPNAVELADRVDKSSLSEAIFLDTIARRLRESRKQKGMTRKALAQASGTSERYLAQIESGKGNLSVLVLRQIAIALKMPVTQFFSEQILSTELSAIIDAVNHLSTDNKNRFYQLSSGWLDEQHEGETNNEKKRIALIGLRGAGKSTLGKRLSREFGCAFVELTHEVEIESGLAIAEIYSLYGEQGYRELESLCLKTIIDTHENVILAVAGGITSNPYTYNLLLKHFHAIWLKASPEEHMLRVMQQGDKRPVRGVPKAMAALKTILTQRETDYARAQAQVDTSGRSVEQSAKLLKQAAMKLIGG